MTEQAKLLAAEALKLSPTERAELVERILSSIEPGTPAADRAASDEARDRAAAYRRGDIEAIDVDGALAKYKLR